MIVSPPSHGTPLFICDPFIDGPEKPILEALPAQPFYLSGDTLRVSCKAEGFPLPTAKWDFGSQIPDQLNGVLNLTNVQTNQAGTYTCTLVTEQSKEKLQMNIILKVYGKSKA